EELEVEHRSRGDGRGGAQKYRVPRSYRARPPQFTGASRTRSGGDGQADAPAEVVERLRQRARLVADLGLGLEDEQAGAERSRRVRVERGRRRRDDQVRVEVEARGEGAGEVEDGEHLAAGDVVEAGAVEPDGAGDAVGEVGHVGRRADLVGGDLGGLAALEALGEPEAEVRAREVLPGAVAERGADDGPAPEAGGADRVLARPLGAAVEVDRVGAGAFVVGPGR